MSSTNLVSTSVPHGAPSTHRVASAATTNATVVKAAPGVCYGWVIYNTNAAARYVKLYDKATTPSGADTPIATIHIAGTGAREVQLPLGFGCFSGISYRIVTGAADADNTAVLANDVLMSLFYR